MTFQKIVFSFKTKLVGKRISGALECKPAELREASVGDVCIKAPEIFVTCKALFRLRINVHPPQKQSQLINTTSTAHLTCVLKAPSSRGGGGGKFPGLAGRAPGSSRGGGGGGRKSPTERKCTQEVNINATIGNS